MRALIQRVSEGAVSMHGEETARIGKGYVVLLGVRKGDTREDAHTLAKKCAGLRVMEDAEGKMNLGLAETGGSALVVSQFTLYADTRSGNRPGFGEAAPPEEAAPLYEAFLGRMKEILGEGNVRSGEFRAMMSVRIVNDGPVTVLIECPFHNQPRSASS
jgi:D-tyrosyl-tRNA(Tyr) deacylase